MLIIQTERLKIRELNLADAVFTLELLNEPAFHRYIGDRGIRDLAGAEKYLREGPMASYARHGFGLWLVARRDDGLPLGICGMLQRDYLPHPDLGFAFLKRYTGRGYAFESSAAVLAHARSTLNRDPILALTAPENPPSVRLLEKLGFRFDRMIQTPVHANPSRLFSSSTETPCTAG